jgi:outer membrane lipoprotein SlyB
VRRGATDPDLVERARATRAFARSHRRPVRPSAYQVYVTLVCGAILGVFVRGAIASLIAGGIGIHGLLVLGPALLLLVVLAAARFGLWQGPVSFSAADLGLVLMAPIASADLVRPKLEHSLVIGALVGAAVGGVALLVIAGGPAGLGLARSVGAVVGMASLSTLCVAVSWLVESSRRSVGSVRRGSPVVVLVAAGLVAAGEMVSSSIGMWSGPWGWAIAPLAGGAGWPLALGLAAAGSAAMAAWALRRAGAASIEMFAMRAGTRSALSASMWTLSYRGAALSYRAAQPTGVGLPIRLRPPTRPRRAVFWRDAIGLVRGPSRVGWAALLGAGATVEALTHPGAILPAGLAAAGLYFAASLLCEPLRVDVDYPDRSAILLSWTFTRVLLAHCFVPALVLAAITALTVVASVTLGVAGAGALALIPTLLVSVVATAVLASALAARRGGRVSEELLIRMLGADPSSPVSATLIFLWLAPWLIATLVTVGGAVTIVGHAVAHHRSVIGAGVIAFGITAAVAGALLATARRTIRPD